MQLVQRGLLLALHPVVSQCKWATRVPAILSEQYVWQVFLGMGACLCYLSHGTSHVLASPAAPLS